MHENLAYKRSWKDRILAASRSALKNTNVVSSTGRISFAKIHEPLEVPNLLDLQIDAYNWLIGNETWRTKVEAQEARTDTARLRHQASRRHTLLETVA